jgi:SM-20-related protein
MGPLKGQIRVIDDPFPTNLAEHLSSLGPELNWRFGWASSSDDQARFWHAEVTSIERGSLSVYPPINAATDEITGSLLQGFSVIRSYANGHTSGCHGSPHTDGRGDPNVWVAVYFAHETWDPDWGGELAFYSPDMREIIAAVIPRPKRLTVFPGFIPHSVRPLSRFCPVLRISLVWKLRVLRENSA